MLLPPSNGVIKQPHYTIACLCLAKAPKASASSVKRSGGLQGSQRANIRSPCQTTSKTRIEVLKCHLLVFSLVSFLPVLQAKQGAHTGHHRTSREQNSHRQLTQPLLLMLAGPWLPSLHVTVHCSPNELPEAQAEYLMRLLSVNGYCDQRRVPVHVVEGLYNSWPYCSAF
jgi:hypothetical protein